MLSRRALLLTGPALLASAQPRAPKSCGLLRADELDRAREAVKKDSTRAALIRKNAAAALTAGPWSVTTHRPENVTAGPHDYYSEGPYWWPDPKNPKGPYIRKDGERNPARFMGNRNDLGNMCSAVLALGMGGYLLGDKRCAEHASLVLSTWCVDPKTRMNPNLEYGQAV